MQSTASFQGTISSAVADADSRLQRSGFCGINTDVRLQLFPDNVLRAGVGTSAASCDTAPAHPSIPYTCLCPSAQVSEGVLNLEDFDTLAYRVRGDGRKYIVSLRTENWLVDSMSQDVWQAFLFARYHPLLASLWCTSVTVADLLGMLTGCRCLCGCRTCSARCRDHIMQLGKPAEPASLRRGGGCAAGTLPAHAAGAHRHVHISIATALHIDSAVCYCVAGEVRRRRWRCRSTMPCKSGRRSASSTPDLLLWLPTDLALC